MRVFCEHPDLGKPVKTWILKGAEHRDHGPMKITDERRTQYGNRHDQDSTGPDNGRKT